ncbi:MAG: hypothetical protein M3Y76_12075 [Chloroflexota bacterium]|nr:hypothetical protein [Chloroflexota bacterium]
MTRWFLIVDLGVDYFMLGSGRFPDLTTLEMLKQEALPMLNAQDTYPLQWFQIL